jgi:hypothetical protein
MDRLEGCGKTQFAPTLSKALTRPEKLRLARGVALALRVPAPPRF